MSPRPSYSVLKHHIRIAMKKSISGLLAIFSLILMLTNPALTVQGAKDGLLLWSQTVLPTLLPFMICSNVIVALDAVPFLIWPFRPFLHKILGLSENGSYVFLCGLLCGYPMGAKTCGEFLSEGRISLAEARYLLSISNHPSPMFLLGFLAPRLSPSVSIAHVALALYLPILPLAVLSGNHYHFPNRESFASIPENRIQKGRSSHTLPDLPSSSAKKTSFDKTMMSSIEIMVRIGGYIMLFSILAAFLGRLSYMPRVPKVLLLGFVEITTGIRAISEAITGFPQGLCLTVATAFGGLSGLFQTKSVLQPQTAGLSIRHYLVWKILHALLSDLVFTLAAAVPLLLAPPA